MKMKMGTGTINCKFVVSILMSHQVGVAASGTDRGRLWKALSTYGRLSVVRKAIGGCYERGHQVVVRARGFTA